MNIIYKDVEYSEGDKFEYAPSDHVRYGTLKFGTYDDHEGYCQYVHLGFYIQQDGSDDDEIHYTLPDVIDIFDGRKVDKNDIL